MQIEEDVLPRHASALHHPLDHRAERERLGLSGLGLRRHARSLSARVRHQRRVRPGVARPFSGASLGAGSGNPAKAAKAAEVAEETARAMAAPTRLPNGQREVVALHIHGQFTFRDVARLVEIPINTAKSRYRYALSALRKELDHDHR